VVEAERDAIAEAPFHLAETGEDEVTVFRCALCGARFSHGRQVCGHCPLNAGCTLVSCPSCGYSFPRSSRLLDWLGRWLARLAGRR